MRKTIMPPAFLYHYGSIKREACVISQTIRREFLYHYGSIKSSNLPRNWFFECSFLYHYGSIKRIRIRMLGQLRQTCFYTTMVRLKALEVEDYLLNLTSFYTTMVRLKGSNNNQSS